MNLGIGFVILELDMRDVDTVSSKCKVHSQSTTNSYGEAQVAYDVFLSVTCTWSHPQLIAQCEFKI